MLALYDSCDNSPHKHLVAVVFISPSVFLKKKKTPGRARVAMVLLAMSIGMSVLLKVAAIACVWLY